MIFHPFTPQFLITLFAAELMHFGIRWCQPVTTHNPDLSSGLCVLALLMLQKHFCSFLAGCTFPGKLVIHLVLTYAMLYVIWDTFNYFLILIFGYYANWIYACRLVMSLVLTWFGFTLSHTFNEEQPPSSPVKSSANSLRAMRIRDSNEDDDEDDDDMFSGIELGNFGFEFGKKKQRRGLQSRRP